MFPRALNQCSNVKRRFVCSNQRNFAGRLPIDFFYFEDFRWSFFGKIIRQKRLTLLPKMARKKNKIAPSLKDHCCCNKSNE